MNTEDNNKTAPRHSGNGTSCDGEANKILPKSPAEAVERAVVAAEQPSERSVGRPKGAHNKRMDALRELQETRFGMTVGELLTHTLFDGFNGHTATGGAPGRFMEDRARVMASRLGIPMGEAMKHVLAMAGDLMPYVHQKLPVALEANVKGIMLAVIGTDGGFASPAGGGGLDLRPAQARQGPAIEGEFEAKSDGKRRTDEE